MYSDSRKAQHNSFAHQRAALLFSGPPADKTDPAAWSAAVHQGADAADRLRLLRQRVAAGVRGYVPPTPAAGG